MRPKTILAVVVLTVAVCAHAVGQNLAAPIDRPQLCVSAFLGVSSINTQPWPALGALGTTLPDCVTTWDALTWPTWEFNVTAGTTVTLNGTQTVSCTCTNLSTVATADGTLLYTGVSSGNAYLAVWDTTSQPYFMPINSVTLPSTINLVNNAPISGSGLQYHIYYFGRVTTFFDKAALNNARVILVWEPTPTQYVTTTNMANLSNRCHNTAMNGTASCYPPSDLLSPNNTTNCSTFSNGGAGTLVGTGDCQTKLAVADLMNFLKQTGRIGTLLGISTGNESDKCPYGNLLGTCDTNFAKILSSTSYDGEWGDSIADHATRAVDICTQAKAVYAPIWCGGPGIESLVTGNGLGTNALCGIAYPNNIKGADWANAWWGTSGILSKMDFFGYHGYFGYIPQAQDYALNAVIATCPNIRAAVQTLPMWNTEHISAYASLSSDSMVQVVNPSGISMSGTTCSAILSQRVQYSTPPFSPFQNPNWNNMGDYMVLAGTGTSGFWDTGIDGVPITAVCHGSGTCPAGVGGSNDTVSWSCSGSTPTTTASTYIYDLTLTYGFAAEAYLLQYFRNVAHRPGAVDVINWEEWINDSSNAQGFPLCFAFNIVGSPSSCPKPTRNGQAMGEALKWMRLGGGVKPTSAFQCATVALGSTPPACPFQGTMFATGVQANGTQVEVVFYTDLSNSPRSTTTFPAPSWAQHYLAVDGTCTSVTGAGASPTQVTLTHAKPIMFTSD